jgi:hypothetical protein
MQVTNPAEFFHHSSRSSPGADSGSNTADLVSATTTSLAARQAASNSTLPTPTSAILALLSSELDQETAIANNTNLIATATGPPAPYVWHFGLFIGLSGVFFIFSLMLPLIGPNLMRIAVQRSYKIRNLWIFWPFVFGTYYVVIYWVIPEAMASYLECGEFFCNRNTDGYYFVSDFATAGFNPINTISYIISAVVMGAIGLVNIALAIMFRQGVVNTSVWLLYAVVVVIVYFVDYYGSIEDLYPYAIGTGLSLSAIIPLAYILLVWSVPQLWSWWHVRKLARKEKMN